RLFAFEPEFKGVLSVVDRAHPPEHRIVGHPAVEFLLHGLRDRLTSFPGEYCCSQPFSQIPNHFQGANGPLGSSPLPAQPRRVAGIELPGCLKPAQSSIKIREQLDWLAIHYWMGV